MTDAGRPTLRVDPAEGQAFRAQPAPNAKKRPLHGHASGRVAAGDRKPVGCLGEQISRPSCLQAALGLAAAGPAARGSRQQVCRDRARTDESIAKRIHPARPLYSPRGPFEGLPP
jgi:hypothetical protein